MNEKQEKNVPSIADQIKSISAAMYTGKKMTVRSDLVCGSKYATENFSIIRVALEEGEVYIKIKMYDQQIIIPVDDKTVSYIYQQVTA